MRKRIKYILAAIVLIAFFFTMLSYDFHRPTGRKVSLDKSDSLSPYRTIPSLDSSNDLLPYTLHKNVGDDINDVHFTAIIKAIDPAKDNYKNYCKSVVADIVKELHSNKIMVYIFDDARAAELQQMVYIADAVASDIDGIDLVDKHMVAVYTGQMADDERWVNYELSFYENAGNGHAEKIYFRPKTGDKRQDLE